MLLLIHMKIILQTTIYKHTYVRDFLMALVEYLIHV